MGDTYRAVIPYESMDPLTIGASTTSRRSTGTSSSSRSPPRNLLAAIYPDEPAHVADATEAARRALELAAVRPALLGADRRQVEHRRHHRQPVPPDAVVEAAAAGARRDRGRRHHRRPRDLRERQGLPDVGVRHRAEGRPRRTSTAWSAWGSRSSRTTRATARTTRSSASPRAARPCGCTRRSRRARSRSRSARRSPTTGAPGGGGKLILPGVVSDETIESNHCAFVPSPQTHYGALAGPMRSDIDEVATMCGLDCTMNVLLDTHGRVLDAIFGRHPDAHRAAIERFNAIYAYENPSSSTARRTSRSAASSRRPTTSSSTPAGAACRPTSC